MRNIIIIFLVFFTLTGFSQENNTSDIIFGPIETYPVFNGGMDSMWCYFESKLNVEKINSRNVKGRMFFEFVIDTSGNPIKVLSNSEYVGKLNFVSDSVIESEIISIIQNMPQWKPSYQFDKKVKTKFHLIVNLPYTEFKCEKYRNDTTVYFETDKKVDFKMAKGNSPKERINNFISSNLTWPSQDDCSGKVYIQFIVEKNGSTTNHEIIRGMCRSFDAEAFRVVKLMSEWTPAYIDNKPVRSFVTIPVDFRLID